MRCAPLSAETPRVRTFRRWCACLLLVVVLLVAVAYVVHGLRGAADIRNAKQRALRDLAVALPASERQAARDRAKVRAAVAASWGRPTYAWQELARDLSSTDAGWIVEYYTQQCRVLTFDLIPVPRASGEGCEALDIPDTRPVPQSTDAHRSAGGAYRGPTRAFSALEQLQSGCPDGILAPSPGTRPLLTGQRPASLGQSPAWIVITLSTDVSSTTLGCSPWDVLFCSAPVDRPVLAGVY